MIYFENHKKSKIVYICKKIKAKLSKAKLLLYF